MPNKSMQILLCCTSVLLCGSLSAVSAEAKAKAAALKHVVVYYEPGRFAGWPANNGVWLWGNEILVGFELGYFQAKEDNHSFDTKKPKINVLARSLDGGETWKLEEPENFVGRSGKASPCPGGIRFNDPNFAMRIGGSEFFISYDRGHKWAGPYSLASFFPYRLTSRTDYLVNGERDCLLFLSGEQSEINAGSYKDRAFCARTTDGGKTFKFLSWITGEPLSVRSVMPTTVRTGPGQLVSVLRRREGDTCWIDAYGSDNDGLSWKFLSKVSEMPGNNGNPPSMARLPDGRLCVAYGSREKPLGIRARVSRDNGKTWGDELLLRQDGRTWDLGYTRTVSRADGKLVTIYYYTTAEKPEQHIEATIWHPDALQSPSTSEKK